MVELVFTDADLFRRITAFQRGLPMPLFDFWRAHAPDGLELRLTPKTNLTLVDKLVEHGTPALCDLAKRATFSYPSAWAGARPDFMALSLFHVAHTAFEWNRADIFEWAVATKSSEAGRSSRELWYDAITRLAVDGDTRMLAVLKTHMPLATRQLNKLIVEVAYTITHVDVLQWLLDEIPGVRIPRDMFKTAVVHHDLAMVRFLHANNLATCDPSIFYIALLKHAIDVLIFLVKHFVEKMDTLTKIRVVTHSDPQVQQLAVELAGHLQVACASQINQSCDNGALEEVREWAERGIISPKWPISIDTAAGGRNIGVIRFLHEQGIATATTKAMDQAAKNGDWELVRFLHENRTEGCTTRAMDAAIKQDSFEHVMFLHENRSEGFSRNAAKHAATNPSVTILRFLHMNIDGVFSPAVMDTAAAHGNLTAIKFLHENRSEGCTTDAMDQAATNGHLNVVEFLHRHRSEGCKFAALRGALKNGHFPVVRFLFDNYHDLFEQNELDEELVSTSVRFALQYERQNIVAFLFDHVPHLFTRDLLPDVLLHGVFDVYTMLQRQNPDGADELIATTLYEAGCSLKLPTIRFIVDVLGRGDLAHRAIEGAISTHRCGLEWLRAVHSVTGSQSCRLSAVRLAVARLGYPARFDTLKYLIRACCEPNAHQVAIEAAQGRLSPHDMNTLMLWNPSVEDEALATSTGQPLHPFLLDARVKPWVLNRLFDCLPFIHDPYRRIQSPLPWAVQAVYKNDLSLLEIIRSTPPPTPWYTHASHTCPTDVYTAKYLLSFENARAAAVRDNKLALLQWLMEHVDLPVEPTLLEEAVYYDRREIAQWLVENYPAACVSTHSHSSYSITCELNEDQLDWLEENIAVREALDFRCVVSSLVQANDADALRRVHSWYPGLLGSHSGLGALANEWKSVKIVAFLEEIGYSDRE